MKKLIPLLILLLQVGYIFSQVGYPKLIQYKGDSVVAITIPQLSQINATKVNLDRYKTLFDSSMATIAVCKELSNNLQKETDLVNKRLAVKDSIIKIASRAEFTCRQELDNTKKKLKTRSTLNGILYGVTGALAFYTIYTLWK